MFDLLIFIGLLATGYFIGRAREFRHYKSIVRREKASKWMPVITCRSLDSNKACTNAALVAGSSVISVDYFKRFIAALRNIFGGRITSYESLLDRARREAILRMKQQALQKGASIVINTRVETSSIASRRGRKGGVSGVEALAYGTALKLQ